MPFDATELAAAYYEILGIPPAEQPPNHYRLLGIQMFESNREVIANAAARQINFVRQHAMGVFSNVVQEILNEIAAAKLCLLKELKKAAYDSQLRARQGSPPSALPAPPRKAEPAAEKNAAPAAAKRLAETSKYQAGELPSPAVPVPAPSPPAPSRPAVKRPTTTVLELPPRPPTTEPPAAAEQPVRRTWLVGRDAACDVIVAREVVSQQHCRLEETGEGFFLVDLDSTNGTYVNGTRVSGRVKVSPHDKITLGRQTPLPWPRTN